MHNVHAKLLEKTAGLQAQHQQAYNSLLCDAKHWLTSASQAAGRTLALLA